MNMTLRAVIFVGILVVVFAEINTTGNDENYVPTTEAPQTNYVLTTEVPQTTTEVPEREFDNSNEMLIWSEDFDTLDTNIWSHFVTAWDGGNQEFQYYRNDRKNSFVEDGVLNIRPTPTVDEFSESFLENGTIQYENCSMSPCASVAGDDIVSPYFSARLLTRNGFSFKYGRVEIKAKLPKGDWLWPAIWMLPESSKYGGWPRSGEIDIVEARGNPDLKDPSGKQHGCAQIGSTLHFGSSHLEKAMTGGLLDAQPGENFSESLHIYEMRWTPDGFVFTVDGKLVHNVTVPEGGYTELGELKNKIWMHGEKDAPFDRRFHFILNVAVGGNFFPTDWTSDGRKRPYNYSEKGPKRQFWSSQPSWIHTWGQNPKQHSLQIDYIRVYQSHNFNYAFGRD